KTCAMCHQTGVAGAPKLGDKADWGPRIAQGQDTLYKHAIEGFNGAKGAMPAKGGNPSLSDDEMKVIVDFMVAKSQ
ncbi:c-type cytochrome, partial [Zoogloea ramigera]